MDQQNLETFAELAKEFYFFTSPDGYEALYALRELFEPDTDKRKIIEFLISEEQQDIGVRPTQMTKTNSITEV